MKRKTIKIYFKIYFCAPIVLISGFLLGGCTRAEERVSTNRSETKNETKASPQPTAVAAERITLPAAEQNNAPDEKAVTVYKSPTCGCCTMWEEHLTKAGFKVTSNKTENMAEIRKQYGVPEKAQSCHTAVVGGYVIEGHVPAADIEKLLKTRPRIAGLAAPGMPPKSPGMQPEGEKPSGYDVLSFDKNGQTTVFTSYLP
jgi:hypothetical protein